MKVLITNITMAERSGTVIVTRDLALSLKRLGHEPLIYTSRPGSVSDELRTQGIPVVSDIAMVTETPDIIHGHHSVETATAALYFPATPSIFVCHDFTAWHDEAPDLPNLVHYVAISHGFRRRLTVEEGIALGQTSVILNGVDTARFVPGPNLPDRPRRALLFAKSRLHLEVVEAACARVGLELDIVGSLVGRVSDNPESLVHGYDLVFASAVNAMECMATGRAVIVCDGRGLAGFVDSARYDVWRSENFGVPTFSQPLTVDAVLSEISCYDANAARDVTTKLRCDADLVVWAATYVDLYRAVSSGFLRKDEAAPFKLGASLLQHWSPSRLPGPWTVERAKLIREIEALGEGLVLTETGTDVLATSKNQLYLSGFHDAEQGGVWSRPPRASIRLRPAAPFSRLTLKVCSLATPKRTACLIDVSINGIGVGEVTLAGDQLSAENLITFKFEEISEEAIWIAFRGDNGASPSEIDQPDTRILGFYLISLRLD